MPSTHPNVCRVNYYRHLRIHGIQLPRGNLFEQRQAYFLILILIP